MNMPVEAFNSTDNEYPYHRHIFDGAHATLVVLHPATSTSLSTPNDDVRDKFLELAGKWKAETGHRSKMSQKFMNRNYLQIIVMGDDVIPILLDELRTKPDLWFLALEIITSENPVKQEHAGHFDLMIKDWIEWGRNRGHISA